MKKDQKADPNSHLCGSTYYVELRDTFSFRKYALGNYRNLIQKLFIIELIGFILSRDNLKFNDGIFKKMAITRKDLLRAHDFSL